MNVLVLACGESEDSSSVAEHVSSNQIAVVDQVTVVEIACYIDMSDLIGSSSLGSLLFAVYRSVLTDSLMAV